MFPLNIFFNLKSVSISFFLFSAAHPLPSCTECPYLMQPSFHDLGLRCFISRLHYKYFFGLHSRAENKRHINSFNHVKGNVHLKHLAPLLFHLRIVTKRKQLFVLIEKNRCIDWFIRALLEETTSDAGELAHG